MTDATPAVSEEKATPIPQFGPTPAQQVNVVAQQARILQQAIVENGLASRISNRNFIRNEGWQLVLHMNGIVPVVVESHPVEVEGAKGWEAHCELRNQLGETVGRGTGMCLRSERTWQNRDEYAVRSMAETRSVGKAARSVYGFVATMAGFSGTPAEEMQVTQSPENIAKNEAVRLFGKVLAPNKYAEAMTAVGLEQVDDDEQAQAVMAQLDLMHSEPTVEAEVVEAE